MKSRYINCVFTFLMAVLLLLSVFPAAAGAASLNSGKNISDQFLPVNFDAYALADLTEVFTVTDPFSFSVSVDGGNVIAEISSSLLFLKPIFNASGLATVTVTATDSGGSAEDSFVVNIYAKVLEPGGAAYNLFGNAVAISGTYAIAGSPGSSGKGAAYIYEYNAGDGWVLSQTLTASDSAAGDYFGWSVAIYGDYAIVGAYNKAQKGAAYIFKKEASGWTQVKKLTASDGASNDWFGHSVAIIGFGTDYYAFVAAPLDDDKGDDSGSVYVFRGNNATWAQSKITAGDGATGDNFGSSVAVSKDSSYLYALIGAKLDDIDGVSNAGSAYVFRYAISWSQRAKLTAAGSPANGGFGEAVAMYGGDTAVVGPRKVTGSGSKVFVYQKTGTDWTNMTSASAELTASDGTATDQFGTALAIDQNYILVGANSKDGIGAAYLYEKEDPAAAWTSMTETKKLIPGDGVSGDKYGSAVGIYFNSADTSYFTVIGAPGDDSKGSNAGAVYFNSNVALGSPGVLSISDIADQTINMSTAANPTAHTADFTVCDPSSEASLTISVSVNSANPSLIPAGNIMVNGGAVPYNHTLSGNFCEDLTLTVTPAQGQVGVADISVTVSNTASGSSASDTFALTVTGRPTITPIDNITQRIGSAPAVVNFTVTDPDTPSAVTVSVSSGNTALVSASGLVLAHDGADFTAGREYTLTITPTAGASGQATITVSATDGTGSPTLQSFVFHVTTGPTISNVTDPVETDEDTPITVYFKVSDPDTLDANLTVTASSDNTELLPSGSLAAGYLSTPDENGNNWQLVINPGKDKYGEATVTISAKDDGEPVTKTFLLTVAPVQDLPVINWLSRDPYDPAVAPVKISNDKINEDASGAYFLKVSDPDGDVLAVNVTSSIETIVPNRYPNISVSGFPVPHSVDSSTFDGTLDLQLIPIKNTWGTTLITVNLDDGSGNTASHSFLLTIDGINDPPVISPIADQIISGTDTYVDVVVKVSDLDGDALHISVTSALAPGSTYNPMDGGTVSINGGTATAEIETVAGQDSEFTLRLTPKSGVMGTATVTVTADDGKGGSVSRNFNLTVTTLKVLTISAIDDQTTNENTPITINFSVSGMTDPGAVTLDTPTSSNPLVVAPAGMILTPLGSGYYSLKITPVPDAVGNTTITLTAREGANSATETFVLTVAAVNNPPAISLNGPSNVYIEMGSTKVVGVFEVFDMESLAANLFLTPTVAQSAGTPVTGVQVINRVSDPTDPHRATFSVEVFTKLTTGSGTVTVTVKDERNATSSASFEFVVSDSNTRPEIKQLIDKSNNSIAKKTVSIKQNTQTDGIRVEISDGEDDTLKVTVTSSNKTLVPESSANIIFNGVGQETVIASADYKGILLPLVIKPATGRSGQATITITVDDMNGGTASEVFYLNVEANSPPVIQSMTLLTPTQDLLTNNTIIIDENAMPGNIVIQVSDADDKSLTVSVSSNNTDLIPNAAANISIDGGGTSKTLTAAAPPVTGTIVLAVKPLQQKSGVAILTVSLNDNVNSVVTADFIVNVNPILPTIEAISDVSIMENTQTAGIPIKVNDGDKDALTITVTSDKASLVPGSSILINGSAGNNPITISAVSGVYPQPSLVIKPVKDQAGTTWITVSVTDGGTPVETKFLLTVTPNLPPVIESLLRTTTPNQDLLTENAITIKENLQPELIKLRVTDSDSKSVTVSLNSDNTVLVPNSTQGFKIDGVGALSKTVTVAAAPLDKTLDINIIPVKNKSGTATITVSASDGENTAVTAEIVLIVEPRTAVIESIRLVREQVTALQNSILAAGSTIPGTQGEMLAISAQDFVRINDGEPFTVDGTSTAIAAGDVVTVYDSDADFISEVTIMENGKTGTIEIELSDEDSDTLTVSATSGNATLAPDSSMDIDGFGFTRTVTSAAYTVPLNLVITPTAGKNGSALVTVSVDEKQGEPPVTAQFLLTVDPYINYIPQVKSILLVTGTITGQTGTISNTGGTVGSTAIKPTDTIRINTNPPLLVSTLPTGVTLTIEAADTITLYQAVYQNGATVSDIAIEENNQTGKIEIWLDDMNGDQLTVSATATVTTLVPTNPANINFDGLGISRSVSAATYKNGPVNLWLTPAANQSGTTNITVSLTDGVITTPVTKTFMLIVNPAGGVNFVPRVDRLRYVRVPYTVAAGDSFLIAPGETVAWDADESMTIKAGDAVKVGTGVLEEIVTGYANTVSGEATFVMHESIAQGVITVSENTPVEIRVYVSDANGDPLTVSAKSLNTTLVPQSGDNLNIDGTGTSRTVAAPDYTAPKHLKLIVTPAVDKTGTGLIEVTVEDDKGLKAVSSFWLTVKQATGPKIIYNPNTLTETSMNEDATYSFPFWISSAEGGLMKVSVSSDSPMLNPELIATLSVVAGDAPLNQIDATGGTIKAASGNFAVTPGQTLVIDDGAPVTIGAGTSITLVGGETVKVYENYNHVFLDITGNGLSADDKITTMATIQHPLNLIIDPADNANSDIFGKAEIFITVTEQEGEGRTTTRKLILTVNPVNDAPVVTFMTVQITPEGSASTTYDFADAPRDGEGNLIVPENARLVITTEVENVDQDTAGDSVSVSASSFNTNLVPQNVDHLRIGNEYFPYALTLLNNHIGTFKLTVIPAQSANSDLFNFGRMRVSVTGKSGTTPTAKEFILNVTPKTDAPTINQGLGITDQTINEDNSPTTTNNPLSFTVEDKDWDTVVVKVWADNDALIPTASIALTGTGITSTLVTEDADGDGIDETVRRATVPTDPNGKYDLKLTFNPLANANSTNNGTANIKVRVEKADNPALFSQESFVLTVAPQPDTPVLSGIPLNLSLTVNESSDTTVWPALQFSTYPAPTGPITITVTDPDWGLLTIKAYGVTAADKALIPDDNIRLYKVGDAPGLNPGFYQLAIADNVPVPIDLELTPEPYKTGIAQMRVELTDGTSTRTADFFVQVNNINTAPAITSITPPATVNEESVTNIPFTLHEWDLDTVTMTAAVTSTVPAGLDMFTLEITGTGVSVVTNPDSTKSYVIQTQPDQTRSLTLKLTGKKDQFGTATVKLLVRDAGGLEDFREFEIVVNNVNDPPTITSSYTPPIPADEDQVTASTPVEFTVNDVDKENLTLSVVSSKPEIVPVDRIEIGGLYSDPENYVRGSDLSVHIIDTNAGPKTLKMKFTPAPNQSGIGNITVNVKDASATASFIFIYEVKPLPDPPSLKFDPIQGTTPQNTAFNFGIIVGDPDGETVTVTANVTEGADILPNANVNINGTGTTATAVTEVGKEFSVTLNTVLTPLPNKVGTVKIAVTVSDTVHTPVTKEFTLTVTPVYITPTITAASPQSIEGEKDAYITFLVTDRDTPYTALLFTVTSLKDSMIPQSNIAAPELIPELSNLAEGYYWFRLGLRSAPNQYSSSASDTAGIKIDVNDGTSPQVTATVAVYVGKPGTAPSIINFPNEVIINEDEPAVVNFSVRDENTSYTGFTIKVYSDHPDLVPNVNIGSPVYLGMGGANTYNYRFSFTPAANAFSASATDLAVIHIEVSDDRFTDSQTFTVRIIEQNDQPVMVITSALPVTGKENESKTVSLYVYDWDGGKLNLSAMSDNSTLVQSAKLKFTAPGSATKLTQITVEPGVPFFLELHITPEINQFGAANIQATVSDLSAAVNDRDTKIIPYIIGEVKPGDLNVDTFVNLRDAILALQIAAGIPVTGVNRGADVNNDTKLSHVEAVFVLQKVAGLR